VRCGQSLDWLAQVAVGVEGRLPTGSERRGLGAKRGGAVRSPPASRSAISTSSPPPPTSFNVNAHVAGPNEQELTASAAAAWRVTRRFAPLVSWSRSRAPAPSQDDELRGKDPGEHVPGFNAKLLPGTTLRLGIELPLTRRATADYTRCWAGS